MIRLSRLAFLWNCLCSDIHRALSWRRMGQSERHSDKAREHDRRAARYEAHEPTEMDGGVR